MSRYRGPKLRIVRRLGELPGLTSKTTERLFPPGQHGPGKAKGKNSGSEFSVRLQEKQKLRYNYGLTEKQLFNYVKEARRLSGATGSNLLQLLEMRLENVVFRLGFANSIPSARQFVNHGHVLVNGKRVNIPSFACKPGDIITVKEKSKENSFLNENLQVLNISSLPNHLELDKEKYSGKVTSVVSREDVGLNVNELFIVEYYSRK
jgi:small subunit ribosomal protein S4